MKKIVYSLLILSFACCNAFAREVYPLEKEFSRRVMSHPTLTAFFDALANQDFSQARSLLVSIRGLNREVRALRATDINRLSDLLFTFARFDNFKDKKREKLWRKK